MGRPALPMEDYANMPARDVTAFYKVTPRGTEALHAAMRQLHLSARGCYRVLEVSRTIADLEGAGLIAPHHTSPRRCSTASAKGTSRKARGPRETCS